MLIIDKFVFNNFNKIRNLKHGEMEEQSVQVNVSVKNYYIFVMLNLTV